MLASAPARPLVITADSVSASQSCRFPQKHSCSRTATFPARKERLDIGFTFNAASSLSILSAWRLHSGNPGRIPGVRAGSGAAAARAPAVPAFTCTSGEPKTATTFLQDALRGNQPWLAARGVLLPGYSHRDHSRASRDLREAPRVASDPAEPWTGEWDVLARQALCAAGRPSFPMNCWRPAPPGRPIVRSGRCSRLRCTSSSPCGTTRPFSRRNGRKESNAAVPSPGKSGSTGSLAPSPLSTAGAGRGSGTCMTRWPSWRRGPSTSLRIMCM